LNISKPDQAALNSHGSPRLKVKWLVGEEQLDQVIDLDNAKLLLPFGVHLIIVDGSIIPTYKELLELVEKNFNNYGFIEVLVVRAVAGG
jgi:hypothetical protein